MPSSEDDKALIKNVYLFKGYGSRKLLAEYPMKNWIRLAWYTAEESEENWKQWLNLTLRFNSVFAPELPITVTWRFHKVVQQCC